MLIAVTIAAILFAGACVVYGFIALYRDKEVHDAVKQAGQNVAEAASELSRQASQAVGAGAGAGGAAPAPVGLAGQAQPQAAVSVLSGATELLKGLASFSDSLSKLKQGIAALVIALALMLLAAATASIEDKIDDKVDKAKATTTTPNPAPAPAPMAPSSTTTTPGR